MPTLIISDLHLGPGRDHRTGLYSPLEDFFADDTFAAFLDHYTSPPLAGGTEGGRNGDTSSSAAGEIRHHADGDSPHTERAMATSNPSPPTPYSLLPTSYPPTTLVLAGDTFNLAEASDSGPDIETAASHHLHTIAAGHPTFFDTLRRWLASGHRLVILPGNHDFELDFPRVQTALRKLLTSPQPVVSAAEPSQIPKPVVSVAEPSPTPNSPISFSHFYHDQPARLYVEHGDRYCMPHQPNQPPACYLRDRYLLPAIKRHIPEITNLSRTYYLTQLLTANPLALLNVLPAIPAYLRAQAKPPELPRGVSEQTTLHTININIIAANWKRAESQLRRASLLSIASAAARLTALALPGAALAVLFTNQRILTALALTATAALARILSAAATHQAENIFCINLPRAAAQDIAPAVQRGGIKTLVFGHSHIPDRARFSNVDYYNTGAWIRAIDPFSLVPLPTQTYLHVDDAGTARLLQWTDSGPQDPIIIRRGAVPAPSNP